MNRLRWTHDKYRKIFFDCMCERALTKLGTIPYRDGENGDSGQASVHQSCIPRHQLGQLMKRGIKHIFISVNIDPIRSTSLTHKVSSEK